MILAYCRYGLCLSMTLVLTAWGPSASAEDLTLAFNSQGAVAESLAFSSFMLQPEEETQLERTETTTFEEVSSGSPFSFDVTYYLYSDYIWRGINLSEYGGEGRERLNHQMTFDVSFDIASAFGQAEGQYGTFSFGTFIEWFAGQKALDPLNGGQNAQEFDYVLSWSYDIEPIATTLTLGWIYYGFFNATDANTHEWYFSLEHDDAWMWQWLFPGNQDAVLNPSFTYYQDIGTFGGSWMELGISHDFALFENFTLTPEILFSIDHRYMESSTHFATIQYGLTGAYDLTPVIHLPDWAGAMTLSGFLYFSDAVGTLEDNDILQDEFYGGVSIGWSWGG